jgi:small acid-soluble spore protein F (minor alpha/beta-type SASP)
MAKKKSGIMSETTKHKLAEDLGFSDRIEEEGWGSITSQEAGNMVKRAIEIAEKKMVNEEMLKKD